MNLQQLRYAVEVERTGSITQAAENLFMGQPNLSKAIRELEREVGIEIFLRTPRGMELTEKGRVFLGYAKQILAQVRQMEELGQGRKPNPRRFSLAAPPLLLYSLCLRRLVCSVGRRSGIGSMVSRNGRRQGSGGIAGGPL